MSRPLTVRSTAGALPITKASAEVEENRFCSPGWRVFSNSTDPVALVTSSQVAEFSTRTWMIARLELSRDSADFGPAGVDVAVGGVSDCDVVGVVDGPPPAARVLGPFEL